MQYGSTAVYAHAPCIPYHDKLYRMPMCTPFRAIEVIEQGVAVVASEPIHAQNIRKLVYGLKQIGDPSDEKYDRSTGKGRVDKVDGQ